MTPRQAEKLIERTQVSLMRAHRKLEVIRRELDEWHHDLDDDVFDLVLKMEPVRGQIEKADEVASQADWVE